MFGSMEAGRGNCNAEAGCCGSIIAELDKAALGKAGLGCCATVMSARAANSVVPKLNKIANGTIRTLIRLGRTRMPSAIQASIIKPPPRCKHWSQSVLALYAEKSQGS